jgi:glutamate-5-semialdehyde dehydrogenase
VTLTQLGKNAKAAAYNLAGAKTGDKNAALMAIAAALEANVPAILAANEIDMSNAESNGISVTLRDRLRLSGERVADIAEAVRFVAGLPDPVGRVLGGGSRPNGLDIVKKATPLGVIGIIYESRPNVTVDSAVLCLKSGNACILRGGSDAINSNKAIVDIMREALSSTVIPSGAIQLVEDTSRETARELMRLSEYLDVLIPRGGQGLIDTVVQNANVPVIETGSGNCHIFVDETADVNMAVEIVNNAKISRPSVCNAVETVLIHSNIVANVLPPIAAKLQDKSVELRVCPRSMEVLSDNGIPAIPATEDDWCTEYLDYTLAVKVVGTLDEALMHIDQYSTHHSEAIVTRSYENGARFAAMVDSAAVYVNASTRFTDGGEFGLGAEIGISSQKLHARGPMGLEELCSYKYIVTGNGQTR